MASSPTASRSSSSSGSGSSSSRGAATMMHGEPVETWLEKSTDAIDKNAAVMRRTAMAVILLLTLNPLLLVIAKSAYKAKLPETFCDDFVLDINSTAECTTDEENKALYLENLMVSGRNCKGSLNKHFYQPPIISVWASNAYDLTQGEVVWHLVTSPAQAGLNSLYPTSKKQWTWIVSSFSKKPDKSPMSAVSTVPGAVNFLACLETNPDVSSRTRGMQVVNPDFRTFCANIATWCGSVCNYAEEVSMPTCVNNRVVGPEWMEEYQMECVKNKKSKTDAVKAEDWDVFAAVEGVVHTVDMKRLTSLKHTTAASKKPPADDDDTKKSDDDDEKGKSDDDAADDDDAKKSDDDDEKGKSDDDDADDDDKGKNRDDDDDDDGDDDNNNSADDDDAADDDDDILRGNSTLVVIGDGKGVSWSSNDTFTCSWSWAKSSKDDDDESSGFSFETIDAYDLYAIGFTMFFDCITILSFLPLVPGNKKGAHHGLYSKRMLEFQHGLHDLKFMDMIKAGNIRALVFLTARVREGDFQEQMQSTCETMLNLGQRLAKGQFAYPFKLIVKVIDEDRNADAFKDVCAEQSTGAVYFQTNLLKMVEKMSQDPKCSWFPSQTPEIQTPPPGGHHRIYSRHLSEFIQFEFHYLRRGWRAVRERTWFENLLGFGERGVLRVGDRVIFTSSSGEQGLGMISRLSFGGDVTIRKEKTGEAATIKSLDEEDGDPLLEMEEIQVPRAGVEKMIDGAGKGVALGLAYDLLRQATLPGTTTEHDSSDGNILTCILDARHHITAKTHFWNTLLGAWWVEEDWGFDEELQYVQVAQNLQPPEHYNLGQQNRMWYSFLSTLLSTVGAVTSSGSGSITKIPLDEKGYKKFQEASLALRSNTEDYLQSIIMLSRGGTGAYVCNYSYTTAKGKDTMLSAYLRWEGGNLAVSSKAIILRQALVGLLTMLVLGALLSIPLVALLMSEDLQTTIVAVLITFCSAFTILTIITTSKKGYKFVHTVTVQQMCLRSLLNPFIGVLGAFFLFSLPMISATAGHIPLQLDGVSFPWTLLMRAVLLTAVQGFMYTGVLATEVIRNDAQKQVLALKSSPHGAPTITDASGPSEESKELSSGQFYVENFNDGSDPRDDELDDSLMVRPSRAWNDAGLEYCLQSMYQMNQMTLQPGKGLMSFVRGILEIISREVFNIDASGWVSGNVERVVFGIPLLNEIFMGVVLYPYPTALSRFFVFFVVSWMALTQAFVWVEEIIAPNFQGIFADRQVKKAMQACIVCCHIFAWFQLADLLTA